MITNANLYEHTENKDGNDVRIDKSIVCSENKSTYRYTNNSRHRVAKIRVDGGLVSDKTVEKCDWLLINWNSNHSFFIELKGSDVRKAIRQINSTLDQLWSDIEGMGITVAHARIVLSKTPRPNLMPTEQLKLKSRLKAKEYGVGTVEVKSGTMTEPIIF